MFFFNIKTKKAYIRILPNPAPPPRNYQGQDRKFCLGFFIAKKLGDCLNFLLILYLIFCQHIQIPKNRPLLAYPKNKDTLNLKKRRNSCTI